MTHNRKNRREIIIINNLNLCVCLLSKVISNIEFYDKITVLYVACTMAKHQKDNDSLPIDKNNLPKNNNYLKKFT